MNTPQSDSSDEEYDQHMTETNFTKGGDIDENTTSSKNKNDKTNGTMTDKHKNVKDNTNGARKNDNNHNDNNTSNVNQQQLLQMQKMMQQMQTMQEQNEKLHTKLEKMEKMKMSMQKDDKSQDKYEQAKNAFIDQSNKYKEDGDKLSELLQSKLGDFKIFDKASVDLAQNKQMDRRFMVQLIKRLDEAQKLMDSMNKNDEKTKKIFMKLKNEWNDKEECQSILQRHRQTRIRYKQSTHPWYAANLLNSHEKVVKFRERMSKDGFSVWKDDEDERSDDEELKEAQEEDIWSDSGKNIYKKAGFIKITEVPLDVDKIKVIDLSKFPKPMNASAYADEDEMWKRGVESPLNPDEKWFGKGGVVRQNKKKEWFFADVNATKAKKRNKGRNVDELNRFGCEKMLVLMPTMTRFDISAECGICLNWGHWNRECPAAPLYDAVLAHENGTKINADFEDLIITDKERPFGKNGRINTVDYENVSRICNLRNWTQQQLADWIRDMNAKMNGHIVKKKNVEKNRTESQKKRLIAIKRANEMGVAIGTEVSYISKGWKRGTYPKEIFVQVCVRGVKENIPSQDGVFKVMKGVTEFVKKNGGQVTASDKLFTMMGYHGMYMRVEYKPVRTANFVQWVARQPLIRCVTYSIKLRDLKTFYAKETAKDKRKSIPSMMNIDTKDMLPGDYIIRRFNQDLMNQSKKCKFLLGITFGSNKIYTLRDENKMRWFRVQKNDWEINDLKEALTVMIEEQLNISASYCHEILFRKESDDNLLGVGIPLAQIETNAYARNMIDDDGSIYLRMHNGNHLRLTSKSYEWKNAALGILNKNEKVKIDLPPNGYEKVKDKVIESKDEDNDPAFVGVRIPKHVIQKRVSPTKWNRKKENDEYAKDNQHYENKQALDMIVRYQTLKRIELLLCGHRLTEDHRIMQIEDKAMTNAKGITLFAYRPQKREDWLVLCTKNANGEDECGIAGCQRVVNVKGLCCQRHYKELGFHVSDRLWLRENRNNERRTVYKSWYANKPTITQTKDMAEMLWSLHDYINGKIHTFDENEWDVIRVARNRIRAQRNNESARKGKNSIKYQMIGREVVQELSEDNLERFQQNDVQMRDFQRNVMMNNQNFMNDDQQYFDDNHNYLNEDQQMMIAQDMNERNLERAEQIRYNFDQMKETQIATYAPTQYPESVMTMQTTVTRADSVWNKKKQGLIFWEHESPNMEELRMSKMNGRDKMYIIDKCKTKNKEKIDFNDTEVYQDMPTTVPLITQYRDENNNIVKIEGNVKRKWTIHVLRIRKNMEECLRKGLDIIIPGRSIKDANESNAVYEKDGTRTVIRHRLGIWAKDMMSLEDRAFLQTDFCEYLMGLSGGSYDIESKEMREKVNRWRYNKGLNDEDKNDDEKYNDECELSAAKDKNAQIVMARTAHMRKSMALIEDNGGFGNGFKADMKVGRRQLIIYLSRKPNATKTTCSNLLIKCCNEADIAGYVCTFCVKEHFGGKQPIYDDYEKIVRRMNGIEKVRVSKETKENEQMIKEELKLRNVDSLPNIKRIFGNDKGVHDSVKNYGCLMYISGKLMNEQTMEEIAKFNEQMVRQQKKKGYLIAMGCTVEGLINGSDDKWIQNDKMKMLIKKYEDIIFPLPVVTNSQMRTTKFQDMIYGVIKPQIQRANANGYDICIPMIEGVISKKDGFYETEDDDKIIQHQLLWETKYESLEKNMEIQMIINQWMVDQGATVRFPQGMHKWQPTNTRVEVTNEHRLIMDKLIEQRGKDRATVNSQSIGWNKRIQRFRYCMAIKRSCMIRVGSRINIEEFEEKIKEDKKEIDSMREILGAEKRNIRLIPKILKGSDDPNYYLNNSKIEKANGGRQCAISKDANGKISYSDNKWCHDGRSLVEIPTKFPTNYGSKMILEEINKVFENLLELSKHGFPLVVEQPTEEDIMKNMAYDGCTHRLGADSSENTHPLIVTIIQYMIMALEERVGGLLKFTSLRGWDWASSQNQFMKSTMIPVKYNFNGSARCEWSKMTSKRWKHQLDDACKDKNSEIYIKVVHDTVSDEDNDTEMKENESDNDNDVLDGIIMSDNMHGIITKGQSSRCEDDIQKTIQTMPKEEELANIKTNWDNVWYIGKVREYHEDGRVTVTLLDKDSKSTYTFGKDEVAIKKLNGPQNMYWNDKFEGATMMTNGGGIDKIDEYWRNKGQNEKEEKEEEIIESNATAKEIEQMQKIQNEKELEMDEIKKKLLIMKVKDKDCEWEEIENELNDGANIETKNEFGANILMMNCKYADARHAIDIVKKAPHLMTAKDKYGMTLLHYVAESKKEDSERFLRWLISSYHIQKEVWFKKICILDKGKEIMISPNDLASTVKNDKMIEYMNERMNKKTITGKRKRLDLTPETDRMKKDRHAQGAKSPPKKKSPLSENDDEKDDTPTTPPPSKVVEKESNKAMKTMQETQENEIDDSDFKDEEEELFDMEVISEIEEDDFEPPSPLRN